MLVTVDLDEPTRYEIVRSWYRVAQYEGDGPQGRVSASGEGVHIRNRSVYPADVRVREEERRMAGDDPSRIAGDIGGEVYRNQVFFETKGDNHAGEWTDSLDRLIAMYERSNGKPGVQDAIQ